MDLSEREVLELRVLVQHERLSLAQKVIGPGDIDWPHIQERLELLDGIKRKLEARSVESL